VDLSGYANGTGVDAGKGSARGSRPDYGQKTHHLIHLFQVLWATSNSPGRFQSTASYTVASDFDKEINVL